MRPNPPIPGQVFCWLTALSECSPKMAGGLVWMFQCKCGKKIPYIASSVINGKCTSCGCKKATQGGLSQTQKRSYVIWRNMMARCENKKHPRFHRYGGRGITVCERWGKFSNFLLDMGERPRGKYLDRIDGNSGYFPKNCLWSDISNQNRKYHKRIEFNGESLTFSEWSKRTGIHMEQIRLRLRNGIPVEKALSKEDLRKGNRGFPSPESVMKMMKTRYLKYGNTMGRNREGCSWKAGWREIGGIKIYARSRWEANYARYLEFLRLHGNIIKWEHEPETFWFYKIKRGVRSFLIDFRVTNPDGSVEYHEVKGWMDSRSQTKLKRMKKYYPLVKLVLIQAPWFKDNSPKLTGLIKDWEK